MGLDMYLKGRRFLWNLGDHPDAALDKEIQKLIPDFCGNHVQYIETEAVYWRKANAIHKWFVDNVQDGEDDCGYYDVSTEDLQTLRDLCQRVLDFKHLANELLPVQSGFFFGGTDYDEWYFAELERTAKEITVLLDPKFKRWGFLYHSSW